VRRQDSKDFYFPEIAKDHLLQTPSSNSSKLKYNDFELVQKINITNVNQPLIFHPGSNPSLPWRDIKKRKRQLPQKSPKP